MGCTMTNSISTVYIVTGVNRGVSYQEEFYSLSDARDYFDELVFLHKDIQIVLNKVTVLAHKGIV